MLGTTLLVFYIPANAWPIDEWFNFKLELGETALFFL